MTKRCGDAGYRRNDGKPCGAFPIKGLNACKRHTGKPVTQARAEGQVSLAVMNWDAEAAPLVDPGSHLLRMIAVTAALRDGYGQHLQAAYDDAPMDRKVATLVGVSYGDGGPTGEYIRGLVQLEALERARSVDWAIKAVAAGLEERKVQLAARQVDQMDQLLRAVLAALGHDPDAPDVRQVVAGQLLALTAS